MIITVQDCSSRGYCSKGMRRFAEKHGLDWIKFVKEGIDSEKLLATKDGMAIKIVERVKDGK